MKVGIQVSSFKPILKSQEEVQVAFREIKGMGADYVQLQWIDHSVEIDDIAKALQEYELIAVSVQEMFNEFEKEPAYYYELCKVCGCDELCLSRIPETCDDVASIKEYALELCAIHETLQKEGKHLSFHPTKNDYAIINGENISKLDVLLSYLPNDITLCLDLYHVEHAGLSIVETLRKYSNRVSEVHFKDYKTLADGSEVLVPAGQGCIEWQEAIDTCLKQNVLYAYVEQEKWDKDPFRCLEEAFSWLNALIEHK